MKYIVIHIVLLLLFLLIHQCSSAQADYLVTTSGDTVRGEIKMLLYGNEKRVQVKSENGKETYSIFQTKGFNYDNQLYHPVKGPEGYTFMKLLKSGYLSLYAFTPSNSTTYSNQLLLKADGDALEVPNLGFKKRMADFLGDCGDTGAHIESGDLTKKELDQIIDEYNKCIQAKTRKLENAIALNMNKKEKFSAWDSLEDAIKTQPDFDGKTTSLEMLEDIKKRIARNEQIPNFILEGLKSTLASQTQLKDALEKALAEIH